MKTEKKEIPVRWIINLKLTSFLFAWAGLTALQAQEATTASGGDASGSGGTVSYSVGQVCYTSQTGASGSVNQGVQQPYEFFTIGIDRHKEIYMKMTVYPNPTMSKVNLIVEDKVMHDLFFQLYDENGKCLMNQKIFQPETPVPMEDISAGAYFLKVLQTLKDEPDQEIKIFKIIKNN